MAFLRRLNHGGDELHAANAIFDAREVEFERGRLPLRLARADRVGEVDVVVRERLEERFRMTGRRTGETAGGGGLRGDIGIAALPHLLRIGLAQNAQIVRILLEPANRLLFAVDPSGPMKDLGRMIGTHNPSFRISRHSDSAKIFAHP